MPNDDLQLTPEMLEQLKSAARPGAIAVTPYALCICHKLLDVTQFERTWHSGRWKDGQQITPGINYKELLCEDCRKEHAGMPRIVCLGCRRLMGFYKPGKQATGFEFEKNRHYHIVACPRCDPKSSATPVIEHERFCMVNRIPTTTNLDLLQEIEQKILQGELEAAKLRQEFNATRKP